MLFSFKHVIFLIKRSQNVDQIGSGEWISGFNLQKRDAKIEQTPGPNQHQTYINSSSILESEMAIQMD